MGRISSRQRKSFSVCLGRLYGTADMFASIISLTPDDNAMCYFVIWRSLRDYATFDTLVIFVRLEEKKAPVL